MERTDVTVQAAIARLLSFIDSIDLSSRGRFAVARREIRAVETADPVLPVEQWYWVREGMGARWRFNPEPGRFGWIPGCGWETRHAATGVPPLP